MREIKFRAWQKNHEKMGVVPKIEWDNEQVKYVTFDNGINCAPRFSTYGFKDWSLDCLELMQYTGLKDKNGVEIYEGDVVKINDNWNNENKSVTTYSTYEVKANLIGGLCFSCLEISEENKRVYRREIGDDAELGDWMYKHLEVIGNIYEEQK